MGQVGLDELAEVAFRFSDQDLGTDGRNGWQNKGGEQADDSDHRDKLDQGKGGGSSPGSPRRDGMKRTVFFVGDSNNWCPAGRRLAILIGIYLPRRGFSGRLRRQSNFDAFSTWKPDFVMGWRMDESASRQEEENLWLNLGFNVILPAIILMKGDDLLRSMAGFELKEAVVGAFVIALLFPLGYGLRSLVKTKKWNFFSILGVISVLLLGGIGIFELPPEYVAIKEALVPTIIGVAVLLSHWLKRPLVEVFLFRPEIFQVELIETRLEERKTREAFRRTLRQSNLWLAASFGLSAVLNYFLARWIVKSPAGTEAFNDELGRMTLLSYPVIVIPSMVITFFALSLILKGLKQHAGLELEEALRTDPKRKAESSDRANDG